MTPLATPEAAHAHHTAQAALALRIAQLRAEQEAERWRAFTQTDVFGRCAAMWGEG